MSVIVVTLDVSKLDKSKEVNDEHPENILDIYATLDVLKLDKSISVILTQSLNIFEVDVIDSFHVNVIYIILFSEFSKLYSLSIFLVYLIALFIVILSGDLPL